MTTSQGHAIDLTRCHFKRTVGDIDVFGTWFFGDASAGPRPCLVLLPANRNSGRRPVPIVILVDQAWIWSEEIGDPAESARRSLLYARLLGLNTADIGEAFRVAGLIRDHLSDLISLPPIPQSERFVAADGISTDENGRTTELKIFDYH